MNKEEENDVKNSITWLIKIQACDKKIQEISARVAEGPLRIKELITEFKSGEKRFEEVEIRLEKLKKERRSFEKDIQDLEHKLEKSKIKLSNIKSNKEYAAGLKEMEDLSSAKSSQEDKALQVMEEIEGLDAKCVQNRNEVAAMKERLGLDKAAIEKEGEILNTESRVLEKLRLELCRGVDREILNRYLLLKERKGGLAISPVISAICQICHIGIPLQQFNELIKCESILSCPNCNRIIYWGEDEHFAHALDEAGA